MRTFDFSPLYRSTIGFDRLVNLLDATAGADADAGYPPYNIERLGETDYRISMAVAGFSEADISIEVQDARLIVKAEKKTGDANALPSNGQSTGGKYLHRGIAERAFERRFQLADYVEVKGASLSHGLLHIDLVRNVPERLKPRQIAITTSGDTAKQIEARAA
jgi:molecular chaperone IbpA